MNHGNEITKHHSVIADNFIFMCKFEVSVHFVTDALVMAFLFANVLLVMFFVLEVEVNCSLLSRF